MQDALKLVICILANTVIIMLDAKMRAPVRF